MSAMDDIVAALRDAPPVPKGSQRLILVGPSAQRSIQAHCIKDNGALLDWATFKVDDLEVMTVDYFDGWSIADCDKKGAWTHH